MDSSRTEASSGNATFQEQDSQRWRHVNFTWVLEHRCPLSTPSFGRKPLERSQCFSFTTRGHQSSVLIPQKSFKDQRDCFHKNRTLKVISGPGSQAWFCRWHTFLLPTPGETIPKIWEFLPLEELCTGFWTMGGLEAVKRRKAFHTWAKAHREVPGINLRSNKDVFT